MKKKYNRLLPAYLWLMVTIGLLILPGSAFPEETAFSGLPIDKIVHIVLFMLLVWLFCRGARFKTPTPSRRVIKCAIIFVAASLLGLLLEFVQRDYIPNRSFELADVYADTVGAFLGVLLSYLTYKKN